MPGPNHSGLQKQVLALFRQILRAARHKDHPERALAALLHDGTTTTSFASNEFRRQCASVKRSEFKKIEYMIRKGEKQLKLLRMPGVTVVGGAHFQSHE